MTIGHQAMLHGCTIGNECLISIQAVILKHASIGEESLVVVCAFVTEGKQFPPKPHIVGSPAKMLRQLSNEEVKNLRANSDEYARKAVLYQQMDSSSS